MYSRITGYYRPVQNWNVGKAQEYKQRKEYDLGHSELKHQGPLADGVIVEKQKAAAAGISAAEQPAEEKQAAGGDRNILFATPTCPNCRIACSYMDKAGFPYEKIMAEENAELAARYGVKQAPTLIVLKDGGFEKYAGAGAIKGFLNNL